MWAVALDSVAAVAGVMVGGSEVAGVVGAAACEGDDVVDGVGSGFAADVADVGVAEDAGSELSPGGGVGGSSGWGLHVSPFSGCACPACLTVFSCCLVASLLSCDCW